jgi:hypothetical protein
VTAFSSHRDRRALFQAAGLVLALCVASPALATVGAQLQRSAFGAFLGHIGVFDGDGLLLEAWSSPGFSNSAADDSAVFLGIERAQGDIRSVRFFMESLPGANNSFALNRIDFRTAADTAPNPVPEPGTLALALGVFAVMGVLGVPSLRVGSRASPGRVCRTGGCPRPGRQCGRTPFPPFERPAS